MSKDDWQKIQKGKGTKFSVQMCSRKKGNRRDEWSLESALKNGGTFRRRKGDAYEYAFFPCEMCEVVEK